MSHQIKKDRFGYPQISEEMLNEFRGWAPLSAAEMKTYGLKPNDSSATICQAYKRNHNDRNGARSFFRSMAMSVMRVTGTSELAAILAIYRMENDIFNRAFAISTP
jgi:hypothetical protein